MKTATKQQGMTMIGWLLTIIMIGFFSIILVKLFPIYIDRFNVASVMSSLKNEPAVGAMSPSEISQLILNRLDVNMVKYITKDNIYISNANNMRVIELDYEVRRNLFGNHSIVVSYLSRVEVPAQ